MQPQRAQRIKNLSCVLCALCGEKAGGCCVYFEMTRTISSTLLE